MLRRPPKNKSSNRTLQMPQSLVSILEEHKSRQQTYCEQLGEEWNDNNFISIVKNLPEGPVKEIVGHSKNMDTFGIYGHKFHGDDQKTANLIEDIFAKILNPKNKT